MNKHPLDIDLVPIDLKIGKLENEIRVRRSRFINGCSPAMQRMIAQRIRSLEQRIKVLKVQRLIGIGEE